MEVTAFSLAQRFVGLREVPGQRDHPQILAMLRLDGDWPEHDEVPWCFTGETEIWTENGWEPLGSLLENVRVAQIDPVTGIVSLVYPICIIRKSYRGEMVKVHSRDFRFRCDPSHRFFGFWSGTRQLPSFRPISSMGKTPLRVPTQRTSTLENPAWSDRDIRLLAAWLGDGFVNRGRLHIQVSKGEKIRRLEELQPIHVYKAPRAYGRSRVALSTYEFSRPDVWGEFDDYKLPPRRLLWALSQRQLRVFLESYSHFDGSERGGSIRLFSSDERLRDWLQMAVALAGFHSSWRRSSISPFSGRSCYEVVYCPEKKTRTIRKENIEEYIGREDLFCVSVPTGAFLMRDGETGTTLMTGNCSAFVNYIAWLLRLPRSKSLAARSWLGVGTPVPGLIRAQVGFDVVVLSRGANPPGPEVQNAPGHVGFYAGMEQYGRVLLLGGNQSNSVSVQHVPDDRVLGIRRLVA